MIRFIFAFILLVPCASFATSKTLLSAVITTGASAAVNPPQGESGFVNQVFQASGLVSASTGAATVKYQGSNDNVNWKDIGSLSLTLGTSATNDAVVSTQNWKWVRANVTALSGTNAAITAIVNY